MRLFRIGGLLAASALGATPALAQDTPRTALEAVPSPATSPSPGNTDYDAGTALRDTFAPAAAVRDFSGVVAIRRNGALIAYESFGAANFESGRLIGPDTLFPAGDLTHSVTAALILYLEERGYLRRQDRLSRFLPDLAGAENVSIEDVLRHRAGLPQAVPGDDARSLIAGLNAAGGVAPGPHPVAESGVNWRLLALIAERAGEGAYETIVGARLFSPLAMHASTFYGDRPDARAATALPYRPGPAPFALRAAPTMPARRGDGGWLATIDDLIRWGQAIESRQIDLFHEDGSMMAGFEIDLSRGMAIYTAQSHQPGLSAGIMIIPDLDLTLAWAANIESGPMEGLAETLKTIAWEGRPVALPERPGETVLVDSHRAAVGRYDWPGRGAARLVEDGAGLWLETGDGDRFFLTPSGTDRLHIRRLNLHLAYRRNETGWVSALDATWPDGTGYQLMRTDTPPAPDPEPAD